jgi:hypothetical protein
MPLPLGIRNQHERVAATSLEVRRPVLRSGSFRVVRHPGLARHWMAARCTVLVHTNLECLTQEEEVREKHSRNRHSLRVDRMHFWW